MKEDDWQYRLIARLTVLSNWLWPETWDRNTKDMLTGALLALIFNMLVWAVILVATPVIP